MNLKYKKPWFEDLRLWISEVFTLQYEEISTGIIYLLKEFSLQNSSKAEKKKKKSKQVIKGSLARDFPASSKHFLQETFIPEKPIKTIIPEPFKPRTHHSKNHLTYIL